MNKSKGKTIIVTGQVDGVPLSFLVDTGTTDTIISERFYRNLPEGSRPPLLPADNSGEQADGSPLEMIGWAPMEVRIGSVCALLPVTVAKVKDDALLGMDFMEITGCLVDPKKKQLKFGAEVVQGYSEKSRVFCAKVTIPETMTIPPGHEMIIRGKVEKLPGMQGFGVVEPVKSKLKDAGAIMARAAVNLDKTDPDKIPIRVFNPTLNTLTIKKRTTVGTLSLV